ncbi:hypothetical protein J0B03_09625 [Alkalibacter rhizosphaerae]|uniref:DUF3887 domain-containing protein n=1 Tax=Alkalibacter rhizosphaerae TaxID=2815577 RepID=A0A974XG14_9FIRM|nr:hypothetical protein [Alkalibacter rhizosphaerae]QSX08055.1 hypothetical protein J0B03_09625 [Alkalibacter rhizosphaerae]
MIRRKGMVLLLVLFLLTGFAAGCSSSENKEKVESTGTPKVEAMLLAFNNEDYSGFAKDFGPMMTQAMTQEVFEDQILPVIGGLIGKYEEGTLTLAKVTEESNEGVDYISAIYRSSFTEEEGDVTVTIWFTNDDEMKIETFVMNSPKLVQGNG